MLGLRLPRQTPRYTRLLLSTAPAHGRRIAISGNHAAAIAAYSMSDILFGFPITPSSNAFELADVWNVNQRKNVFGDVPSIYTMQSEAGVAGALHGAISTGALASTFTSSQGLLLMIPNLFKMGPAQMPIVIHVAARSVIRQIGTIFCDHSDVMACRSAGWGMLFSSSVQETHDLGLISHIASLRGAIPIMHVYDGFRTSHEIANIDILNIEDIKRLVPTEDVLNFRKRSFNPEHPHIRGVPADYDVYMQWQESAKPTFQKFPAIIDTVFEDFSRLTGRKYSPFQYHGSPNADNVLVLMGSAAHSAEATADFINKQGYLGMNVGVVSVKMFRPWSEKHFLDAIPSTAKHITVLDRTREFGASGEPLYHDVISTLAKAGRLSSWRVLNGIYGIAGKELTPAMIVSAFHNNIQSAPKNSFTVGIQDDVSNNSLEIVCPANLDIDTKHAFQSVFWGLGADGTVGATQESISIITEQTDMNAQGYFAFEAKKTGGWTFSFVRIDPKNEIKSRFEVLNADFIACNHSSFLKKYPVLDRIKENGTFVINCNARSLEKLDELLPAEMKHIIAERNVNIYVIDAFKISNSLGLGKHINMIMQSIFFRISGVLEIQKVEEMFKTFIKSKYGKHGQEIVSQNVSAVELSFSDKIWNVEGGLKKIEYDSNLWLRSSDESDWVEARDAEVSPIIKKLFLPVMKMHGNELPVSAFTEVSDGRVIPGTSKFEKRDIASKYPLWKPSKCSTCNICALVCSQSAIRPFLLSKEEIKQAPSGIELAHIPSKTFKDMDYSLSVSPMDCLGCGVCVAQCPSGALEMTSVVDSKHRNEKEFEYLEHLHNHGEMVRVKSTVRGSQFQKPLMEFPGACEGCGEAMYAKALTQMFGERMYIANATGCSIVWGSYFPSMAYTTSEQGYGPAWGNSLFEDNAEYGYGMARATQHRRHHLAETILNSLSSHEPAEIELAELAKKWAENLDDARMTMELSKQIKSWLSEHPLDMSELVCKLRENQDILCKPSHWIIGGDGWAYDIGFGGLDHVMAQADVDVNMFVFDNEFYANTGFQMSKASPRSSVNKFSSGGKRTGKKDLGMMMIQAANNHAYIASISLGANYGLALQAIKEAEAFPGPSLIIAYSPCIGHGLRGTIKNSVQEEKLAVECGYWPLYRYNPLLAREGKNPFIWDFTTRKKPLSDLLSSETRFHTLNQMHPEIADDLQNALQEDIDRRWQQMQRMSQQGQ